MFLTNGITQEDIDEAVEMKAVIEEAITPCGGLPSTRQRLDICLTRKS